MSENPFSSNTPSSSTENNASSNGMQYSGSNQYQTYGNSSSPYNNASAYRTPYGAPAANVPGAGLGLAAMILGIIGIVTCWFGIGGLIGLIGLILGIVALVKLNKVPGIAKGKAITGIVTSAISLLIGSITSIFLIVVMASALDSYSECSHLVNNQSAYNQCIGDYVDSAF